MSLEFHFYIEYTSFHTPRSNKAFFIKPELFPGITQKLLIYMLFQLFFINTLKLANIFEFDDFVKKLKKKGNYFIFPSFDLKLLKL